MPDSFALGLLAATVLVLVGCETDKDERGMKYMPEMYDSPALKTQEAFA